MVAETSSRHRLGDDFRNPRHASVPHLWRSNIARSFFGLLVVGAILTAIATIASADDAKNEAIKKDRKQIEGTWRVVALEVNGNKAMESTLECCWPDRPRRLERPNSTMRDNSSRQQRAWLY